MDYECGPIRNHKAPCTRQAEGRLTTGSRRPGNHRSRVCNDVAKSRGIWQPLKSGTGKKWIFLQSLQTEPVLPPPRFWPSKTHFSHLATRIVRE